jgi:hypothetical protein
VTFGEPRANEESGLPVERELFGKSDGSLSWIDSRPVDRPRFERRLLERSETYNERNAGTIALPQYKFTLRRAFPGVEGQLDHDRDESAAENGDDADAPEAEPEGNRQDRSYES